MNRNMGGGVIPIFEGTKFTLGKLFGLLQWKFLQQELHSNSVFLTAF